MKVSATVTVIIANSRSIIFQTLKGESKFGSTMMNSGGMNLFKKN